MKIFARSVPALFISTAGAGLAFMWINIGLWPLIFLLAYLALIGLMLDILGRIHFLPASPVKAMRFMEFWFLLPAILTAFCIAAIALAGKYFWKTDSLDPATKDILLIVGAGLVSFFGIFIKLAEEADKNWLAPHIRKSFQARFKRKGDDGADSPNTRIIDASSDLERWIYSDVFKEVSGWEFPNRYKRAKSIAALL